MNIKMKNLKHVKRDRSTIFVGDEGRIIGRLIYVMPDEWWAEAHGQRIGEYITEETARFAVEGALDRQLELFATE